MKRTFLALIAFIATANGAWAHSKSNETTPANEAVVQAVEVIEMRFDAPMRVTAVSLSGPNGDVEIERETGLDPVTEFRAVPSAIVPAGAYKIEWRGLSSDGHPMQGTFGFTVTD